MNSLREGYWKIKDQGKIGFRVDNKNLALGLTLNTCKSCKKYEIRYKTGLFLEDQCLIGFRVKDQKNKALGLEP